MTKIEKFGTAFTAIFCILAFTLMACTIDEEKARTYRQQRVERDSIWRDNAIRREITEIEIKGHLYLVLEYKDGYGAAGGITHAVHCPCLNNSDNGR